MFSPRYRRPVGADIPRRRADARGPHALSLIRGLYRSSGPSRPRPARSARRAASSISAGDNFACAILVDGAVKCWGNGESGALGSGNDEDLGDEPDELGVFLPKVDLGVGKIAVKIR